MACLTGNITVGHKAAYLARDCSLAFYAVCLLLEVLNDQIEVSHDGGFFLTS